MKRTLKRSVNIAIWHDFDVQIAEYTDGTEEWRLRISSKIIDLNAEEVERLRDAFTWGMNSDRAEMTAFNMNLI